ncbi:TonB-dependent receptor [Aquimarina sp. AD10]|uniref:SusC/RagA family TonB-linked outer membrane protein n=1 Tax=Aquimarina TaxID=290174 RepID=UPI00082FC906|nr:MULTISPECIES: TonB-dependent receptor [Aquimarina]AXT59328.1 TonB-dependent receptor [Aquimarina sp. AD10]RKM95166.1 TonB-dependent receptor [Aquimarina sp. AD10]
MKLTVINVKHRQYRKWLLVLLVLLIPVICVHAQTNTITGKVFDNGIPLPGVNVFIKNSTSGTQTDFDGNFVLNNVPINSVLVFSYIGFEPQEVTIGTQTSLSITMKEDSQSLEEVIVVGYGAQRKSDLTGAISSISADEIVRAPVVSTTQALQGRAPGVSVIANSGQPGAAPLIRIRGTGTINNTAPYVIIDGVPGDLNNINPSDVKSIEVLKDASATAIYGSNGANGVILVTTKAGRVGKLKININSSIGTRNQIRELDVLNSQEYAGLINEGLTNSGEPARFTNAEAAALPTFEWGTLNLQTGFFQNQQVSLSGGTEKVNYFVSYGYVNEEGTLRDSNFDRHNLRINNEYKVNDNIKFGHRITYSITDQNTRRSFGAFLESQSAINGWAWEPYLPFFDQNGGFTAPVNRTAIHPLAEVRFDTNNDIRRNFGLNAYVNVDFLKDFNFVSTYAPGFGTREAYDFDLPTGTTFAENGGVVQNQRRLQTRSDRFTGYTWSNVLTYAKEIGRHNITALIGHEQQESESFISTTTTVDIPDIINDPDISSGTTSAAGSRTPLAVLSYFSRVSYNFADRYLLTGTMRWDGASVFGENERFGRFPAISAAWNVHNEKFLENSSFINQLKLRGGYGEVGNRNIGTFGYLPRLQAGPTSGFDVVFDGARSGGAAARQIANQSLKWERAVSTNFGIDISFLNDFSITVDYFDKDTDGAILPILPLTQTSGLSDTTNFNIAEINNKGWEFSVSYKKRFGDFGIRATGYMDMIDNEVTSLDRDSGFIASGTAAILEDFARTEAGFPISYFYGLQTNGIYQNAAEVAAGPTNPGDQTNPNIVNQPGDIRYVDQNGDNVIDGDDRVQIGSPHPDFTYSINLDFDYKQFDLSLFFQGVEGNDIFTALPYFFEAELSSNFTRSALGRWTGPGTSNTLPRLTVDNTKNVRTSDRYVYDGSYLRLKTVQLGYNFPKEVIDRLHVDKLRVYFSGQNLITWDNYDIGLDPEIGTTFFEDATGPNNRTLGLDRGVYPQPRTLLFGINLTL